MLTQPQLRFYRMEWSKCRKALMQYGRTSKQAEEERKKLHAQACGAPKSSLDLTNSDLDKVLALFWTWSKPASLGAQLRQENQTGIRLRWTCKHLLDLIAEADPDAAIASDKQDAYINGLFNKLNPKCPKSPDWAEFEEWHKVQSALTYRYDQVVRKILGKAGKTERHERRRGARKRVEFHPNMHSDHMARIRRHRDFITARSSAEDQLIAAGYHIDEGDPF